MGRCRAGDGRTVTTRPRSAIPGVHHRTVCLNAIWSPQYRTGPTCQSTGLVHLETNQPWRLRRPLHRRAQHLVPRPARRQGVRLDCSPMAPLRQLRMRHAASMLAANVLSIEQIAHAVGYNNRSNFLRAFRQIYGHDPSDYRVIACRSPEGWLGKREKLGRDLRLP